jgi:hypothetical protein
VVVDEDDAGLVGVTGPRSRSIRDITTYCC